MEYLEELGKKVADLEKRIESLESGKPAVTATPITEPIDIMGEEVPFVVPVRKQELGLEEAPEASKAEETPKAPSQAAPAKPTAASASETKQAWMVDAPASPLSNIMSGIALKDRSIFINTLFKEDPKLFLDTVGVLNAMPDFSKAKDYLYSNFAGWNYSSAVVYRFMMAVRRKLN